MYGERQPVGGGGVFFGGFFLHMARSDLSPVSRGAQCRILTDSGVVAE